MKRRSLSRRLILSVLLVELIFAVAVIALAAAYERHDATLQHLAERAGALSGEVGVRHGSVPPALREP